MTEQPWIFVLFTFSVCRSIKISDSTIDEVEIKGSSSRASEVSMSIPPLESSFVWLKYLLWTNALYKKI